MAPKKSMLAVVVVVVVLVTAARAAPAPREEHREQPVDRSHKLGRLVSSLLTSILERTLYERMENLLLDPGRGSDEKSAIVATAVHNYNQQQFRPHSDEEDSSGGSGERAEEFTKLAGYWIRETPSPKLLASTSIDSVLGTSSSSASDKAEPTTPAVSYHTEAYEITDLFSDDETTTTVKPDEVRVPKEVVS